MFRKFIIILLLIGSSIHAFANQKENINFAVFAYRPKPIMHEKYDPIMDYLNTKSSKYHVHIDYYTIDEMYEALSQNKIDIFFTTPAQYIKIRHNNSLASTFATLSRNNKGKGLSMLGGVIVTKSNRDDINILKDIRGKKISTPGKRFFGGFAVQAYEMLEEGIEIKDSPQIIETDSHDKAFYKLLNNKVDVAFIRTGIIEAFIKEGKIKADEVKIINKQLVSDYPYLLSTKLYPEWPLVALPHVNSDFLREFSSIIFALTPDNTILKNSQIAGFIPPKDYLSVEQALRALRLDPFNKVNNFTRSDIVKKYTIELIAIVAIFGLFIILFIIIFIKNKQIKNSRDIYKKLSIELENSELLKRNILSTMPDMLWLKDIDGTYIMCNPEFENFFGAKESEIKGKTDYDFVDKGLADSFRFHDQKAMKAKTPLKNEEWVFYATDNRRILLETTKQKLINNDGTVFGVLGVGHEITHRYHLEKSLQEEKDRFSLAIEGAQDGLWDWDLQTDEVYLTERFETMLDYNVGDLPQNIEAWFGLLHPDDKEKAGDVVKKYLDSKGTNGTYENTFRLRAKDGSWRWILGRGKAQFDEDGTPIRFVGFNTDISVQMDYQNQLDHTAKHDSLTQLPNRFLLSELLTHEMHSVKRKDKYLALLFIDLDGFKEVNDTHGHEAGDEVLTTVALRMHDIVRDSDIVSRIGGDEFVIVVSELTNSSEVIPMLQRLLSDISSSIAYKDIDINVSASIGISFYPQKNDLGNEALIRQADQAMYDAKLLGKNQYHFFNIEASHELKEQQKIVINLREALKREEFVLYYQPKIDLRSNQVIGFEALLRWNHPQDGLLYPDSFLPLVENESSFMIELGQWVFENAFAQLQIWHKEGLEVSLSINVSSYEVQQENFAKYLAELFVKFPDIKADSIEIEILETAALDNFTQTSKILNECQDLGVSIAIDDFGTGYASLNYLQKLPMNTLKIDKSFIIDLLSSSQNISIVESSIGLANAFNSNTVAEGVESEEHGKVLKQLGCELAQGYAIAKAMPANEVVDWTTSWKGFDSWVTTELMVQEKRVILHALVEHRNWINSIEEYILGKTTKLPQLASSHCYLGNWILHVATSAQRKHPEFAILEKLHTQLHKDAEKLLRSSDDNKKNEMKELKDVSIEILSILDKL